jgi:hypothetical protein
MAVQRRQTKLPFKVKSIFECINSSPYVTQFHIKIFADFFLIDEIEILTLHRCNEPLREGRAHQLSLIAKKKKKKKEINICM